jgi:hypothetical protein
MTKEFWIDNSRIDNVTVWNSTIDSLRRDEVDRAIETYWDEKLEEVKWDVEKDTPYDIWEGSCDRFQEARDLFKDIPIRHEEERRLRSPGFFAKFKEEWNGLMREAVQTGKDFEDRFGDANDLRNSAGQARKHVTEAQAKVKEWSY